MKDPETVVELCNLSVRMGREPRLLVFFRDPLDHLISAWAQQARAKNLTLTLRDATEINADTYRRILRFLETIKNHDLQSNFTILNYSRISRPLSHIVMDWLGIKVGSIEQAARGPKSKVKMSKLKAPVRYLGLPTDTDQPQKTNPIRSGAQELEDSGVHEAHLD